VIFRPHQATCIPVTSYFSDSFLELLCWFGYYNFLFKELVTGIKFIDFD
jgi:hypothetical protein